MKATARSIRIAPKKASLIAKLVRGKRVADAIDILVHTNKKGARMIEQLIRSAAANASHNDKQDAQTMVVRTLTVNKAQAYHRGVPMARGRIRRMRKFLSHITVTLGVEDEELNEKSPKTPKKPTSPKNEGKGAAKDSSDSSEKKEKATAKKKTEAKTSTKKTEAKSESSSDSSDSSDSSVSSKEDSSPSTT